MMLCSGTRSCKQISPAEMVSMIVDASGQVKVPLNVAMPVKSRMHTSILHRMAALCCETTIDITLSTHVSSMVWNSPDNQGAIIVNTLGLERDGSMPCPWKQVSSCRCRFSMLGAS